MEDRVRIGAAAQALGVSTDTLRRWEREGKITFERSGNQRYLLADDLARLLRERGHDPRRTSARNRFAGIVIAVEMDGVMAKVELACGPYRVVSLMSREAAEELQLRPGVPATAIVKSTSVMVDRSE